MLKLRPFIRSDAEKIVSWIGDEVSFRKWCADRFENYPITAEDLLAQYDDICSTGKFFPMTAVEGETPVGHLILRYPGEDKKIVRLGYVIIDSARRGKGLGKEMLRLAIKEAKEKLGAENLTIGVFANNEPAHRCYLSVGFKDIPTVEEHYHIFNEDWLCLEMFF